MRLVRSRAALAAVALCTLAACAPAAPTEEESPFSGSLSDEPEPKADTITGGDAGEDGGEPAPQPEDVPDPEPAADTKPADPTSDPEPVADVPEVVPDPEPEIVEEPEPPPALPLEAAFVESYCASWCPKTNVDCVNLAGVGEHEVGCVSLCKKRLAETGHWLGNYECYGATCDLDLCFGTGEALLASPACDATCAALDGCQALSLLALPAEDAAVCRGACPARLLLDPFAPTLLGCLESQLGGAACDTAAAGACFEKGADCASVCGAFLDPGGASECKNYDPIHETWPDAAACTAACEASAEDAAVRFFGCLLGNGCQDPAPCLAPPAEPDPACTDACAAGEVLCGAPFAGAPSTDFCGDLCTGLLQGLGVKSAAAEAGACVTALLECPAPEALLASLAGCVVPTAKECPGICDAKTQCSPEGIAGLDPCLKDCTLTDLEDHPQVFGVSKCIELQAKKPEGGYDCAAVEGCLPVPDPILCDALCVHIAECSEPPVPPTEDCPFSGCAEPLAANVSGLPAAACRAVAPCESLDQCKSLAGKAPKESCVDACAGSAACSADFGASACPLACTGVLSGLDLAGLPNAQCVVGALGTGCDVENAAKACGK